MILDIFSNNPFRAIEMTAAINQVEEVPTLLGGMGLFREVPLRVKDFAVELSNKSLNILPTRPWGGTPTYGTMEKRRMRTFSCVHIPHNDYVSAFDVMGVYNSFAMQGGDGLMSVAQLVADKLTTMRAKHDLTKEYLRWGALTGVVLDADGSELLDIYEAFGLTPVARDFVFSSNSTDINAVIIELKRYFEVNRNGLQIGGLQVMCGVDWFAALMAHPWTKEFLTQTREAQNQGQLGVDYRNGIRIAGLQFSEVSAETQDADGNSKKFIADNKAIAFPTSTQGMFETYLAPAAFIETINTPGQPLYAKQKVDDWQTGVEIATESNPMPFNRRPDLVVSLTMS